MPAKHTLRHYQPNSYFHVFNRGVAKLPIFLDQADKRYFMNLLDRHLNPETEDHDKHGAPYPKFEGELELLCYCLMKNHYHLLIYANQRPEQLAEFMHSLSTAYTMYFNLKYKRVGPLFQGRFRASRVTNSGYLFHISRYIHMNPREYETYKYSSLPTYLGGLCPGWLQPQRMRDVLGDIDYLQFLRDYEPNRQQLEDLKRQLANF